MIRCVILGGFAQFSHSSKSFDAETFLRKLKKTFETEVLLTYFSDRSFNVITVIDLLTRENTALQRSE